MTKDAAAELKAARTVALGGMAALAVAMGIGRFAFTPLLPMMQRDAGLSLTDGGWLASANYLGYLAGALSAVWIRVAPTVMVRVGLLLTAALTFAMGLTHALPLWLFLRGMAGVASAWILVYAAAWALPVLTQGDRAPGSGLMFSGVGAGIVVTGLACFFLASRDISSPTLWRLLGVLALLLSLATWGTLTGGDSPAPAPPPEATRARWSPATWRLVLCYGVFGFGYIIPATFLPVIARRTLHVPQAAGLFWPVFGLAAFLSTLLAAAQAGQGRERWVFSGSFALQALGVGILAVSPTVAGTALCALLVGGTFMVITMQGLREARRIAGPGASRLMGAMTAAFAVGQMLGPVYASALIKSSGNFSGALLTAAILMAVGATVLWRNA